MVKVLLALGVFPKANQVAPRVSEALVVAQGGLEIKKTSTQVFFSVNDFEPSVNLRVCVATDLPD